MRRYIKFGYFTVFLITMMSIIIMYEFLGGLSPLIIFIIIGIIGLINILSNKISKRLTLPLNHINSLLEHKTEDNKVSLEIAKSFKEVEPIRDNIDYLIRKLHYDLAEMERTQQMRTDFVANVSHELKSPLTSIKGFAELIASGLIHDKAKQEDYLNRIVGESDRLLGIINDILLLSEVEGKKLDNESLQEIQLDEIAREVLNSLESLAKQKNIMMIITGKGSIKARRNDLWELIYNLMDNGIKYGVKDGFVQVRIEESDHLITLTVSDNGIGIGKEHLPRIFERFYRADKARNRKDGSTGLGLSIVKNIVLKYNGSITADSIKGDGTSFKIKFKK